MFPLQRTHCSLILFTDLSLFTNDWPHKEATLFQDYRQTLKDVLRRRKQNNPRYSLRAFARDLGTTGPRLSEVLNGKKGLSLKAAVTMARKLGFDESQTQHFCDLVEKADARSETARKLAALRLNARKRAIDYQPLSADIFCLVSDWYHYAILELMALKDFQYDAKWIAKALRIETTDAKSALERLMRLDLVKVENGKLVRTLTNVTTTNNVPSEAIRHHNLQILKLASEAIQNAPLERRNISSMTMAIDPALLPEAAERIRTFRRELCAFLESGNQKEIYCLALQLFPMSHLEK